MDTSMPTVRTLFDSRIVYVIPSYQRTYVWNEDDQWEPLWLDIVGMVAPAINGDQSHDLAVRKPHFLGATVLKEMPAVVDRARQIAVVDGQQRLTTLQLLLTSVADAFRETPLLSSLEDSARNLTINYIRGAPSVSEPDKIRPLAGDFQLFGEIMKISRNGDRAPEIEGPIGDCYRYFRRKASKWLSAGDPSEEVAAKRANALMTAISDKLQVVAIHLNHDENESAIFEALNARGEPLSEWEKTKNYILFKAGEDPEIDQDDLYERYLLALDGRQWLQETGRGVGRRRISDLFLDYWLESKLHRPISTRRVYREFRAKLEAPDTVIELEEWCKELKADGEFFLHWQTTEEWDGDVETVFHSRRRAIDVGAVWPVLLALHRSNASPEDLKRCLKALDSYLWRRAIVGLQAKSYDEIVLDILKRFSQALTGETPFSSAIIKQLSSYEIPRYSWPSDNEMRQAVTNRKMPGWVVRQVLEAVERGMMRGKRPGNSVMSGGLPIEHLLPQGWNVQDWPLPDIGDDEEEIRNNALHRLGNLTLVDHGLNSKLSNRSWIEKRKILEAEDNLYINKDLLQSAPDDHWDEEQIQLRGERLADYLVEIWPRGEEVTGEIERLK